MKYIFFFILMLQIIEAGCMEQESRERHPFIQQMIEHDKQQILKGLEEYVKQELPKVAAQVEDNRNNIDSFHYKYFISRIAAVENMLAKTPIESHDALIMKLDYIKSFLDSYFKSRGIDFIKKN